MNEPDVSTDLSTTEVHIRTVVRSPRTPMFKSPESADWITGAPCTTTRAEYEKAVAST